MTCRILVCICSRVSDDFTRQQHPTVWNSKKHEKFSENKLKIQLQRWRAHGCAVETSCSRSCTRLATWLRKYSIWCRFWSSAIWKCRCMRVRLRWGGGLGCKLSSRSFIAFSRVSIFSDRKCRCAASGQAESNVCLSDVLSKVTRWTVSSSSLILSTMAGSSALDFQNKT